MKLLNEKALLYIFFSIPFFAYTQTYTTELGREFKHSGDGWCLMGKSGGDYFLDYRNNYRQFNFNGEFQKEVEVPFDLSIKEGYQTSDLFLVGVNPVRVDLYYNKKKKCYQLSGTYIETPEKGNVELYTCPIKDKSLFFQRRIQNDEKSFSMYTYYAGEDKLPEFQFKTFDSNLQVLNNWSFKLPYKAGTLTFPANIAKHTVKEVYNIGNRKVCLIIEEDISLSGKDSRHQIVAYIHDLSSNITDKVVLKNISAESSVKLFRDADRVYVYSELHKNKEFVGISTVVLNTQNLIKETDKETLFKESDITKALSGTKESAINKRMIPVKMHVTPTGNIFVLYESSYLFNISSYGPSVGGTISYFNDRSLEYVYGDIVVFSISKDGDLKQIHKISKSQRTSEKYKFGSFYSHIYQDKLFVFLNDFPSKYITSTIQSGEEALVIPEKGAFMAIRISENGEKTWKEVCKTVIQGDFIISSEDIIRLDDNRILIPVSDNRNMYSKKQKLMFLTIEN